MKSGYKIAFGAILVGLVIVTIVINSAQDSSEPAKLTLKYINNWSLFFSALATIFLAIAAFHSISENRKMRIDDKKQEFRRTLLNDIERWAKEGIDNFSTIYASTEKQEEQFIHQKVLNQEKRKIVKAAQILDDGQLIAAIIKLDVALGKLNNFLNGEGGNYVQLHKECKDLFSELLETVVNTQYKEVQMSGGNMVTPQPQEEPTLKDVMKELKDIKKSSWVTPSAFGASLVLLGVSIWLQQIKDMPALVIGIVIAIFIALGVGFLTWCLVMLFRIK